MGRAVSRKANAAERQIKLALFVCSQGSVTRLQIQRALSEYAVEEGLGEAAAKRADAAVRKRLERDKNALADAGILIKTAERDTYRIAADTTAEHDIIARLEAGSPQASLLRVASAALLQDPAFLQAGSLRMALAKLSGPLEIPDSLYWAEQDSLQALRTAGGVGEGTRRKVHTALSNCKTLSFEYVNAAGRVSQRSVEPIGVYAFKGREYLAAWDSGAEDSRSFRLDRMKRVSVHDNGRGKPDFEPREFKSREWQLLPFQMGLSNVAEAEVRIAPSALWQARNLCSGFGELVADDIGRTVWRVTCSDAGKLAAWCIANGPGLVPVAPQEAADAYRRLASEASVWTDGKYVTMREECQAAVEDWFDDSDTVGADLAGNENLSKFAQSLVTRYALPDDALAAKSGVELTDNDVLFAVLALLEEAGAVSIPQTALLLDVDEQAVYRALETLAFCYDSAAGARLDLGEEGCSYAVLEHPAGLHLALSADQAAAITAAAVSFTASEVIGTVTAACGEDAVQPLQIAYWKEGALAPRERIVEPQGMVTREGYVYLQAWCRTAGAQRLFRLDRITNVKALPAQAAETATRTSSSEAKPLKALVGMMAGLPVPDWPGAQKSKKAPADNRVTFTVPWYGGPWLPKHLASLGADVVRIEPPRLADATGTYARSLLEQLRE